METTDNATTLVEIEPEAQRVVFRILPIILPALIIFLFLSRKTPYGAIRVGKSRWWSLIPGQIPMRFEMDRWAERGYRKASDLAEATLDMANKCVSFTKH